MTTQVIYTFFEMNERVQYFVDHALFEAPDVDFVFVCNHPTLSIPSLPSYVLYLNRENVGFDFGGWSFGILPGYDYYIFVNASVWGPLLPSYFNGRWTDIFVRGLGGDIKLFGCTINTLFVPHVQSYVFAVDQETLMFLCERGIFSNKYYEPDKKAAIVNREMRMSKEVLTRGWGIGCLMKYYQDVDFRKTPLLKRGLFDVVFANKFFGQNLHPHEIVFMKGNRNFSKAWLQQYL